MLTKDDKKFLKDNFATKDDLRDLRSQISDDVDGKLKIQKQEILEEVDVKLDSKLAKQKDAIVKDVATYVADTIVPMFDERDKKITRIEKKLNLPPLAN